MIAGFAKPARTSVSSVRANCTHQPGVSTPPEARGQRQIRTLPYRQPHINIQTQSGMRLRQRGKPFGSRCAAPVVVDNNAWPCAYHALSS